MFLFLTIKILQYLILFKVVEVTSNDVTNLSAVGGGNFTTSDQSDVRYNIT